jgi:hypothetical protein
VLSGGYELPTPEELDQWIQMKTPLRNRLKYGFGRIARALGQMVTRLTPSIHDIYGWSLGLGQSVADDGSILKSADDGPSLPPSDSPGPLPSPGTSKD